MADEMNKDVVGARISLDTSKMIQSFKTIDDGARGNAESFKRLNTELDASQKHYTTLVHAADKLALTSEERRKKILAESDALVKQRTAQAELFSAKKQQLDQTNNLVDAKLKSQQAIIKKRESSIEQQEKEHIQRMQTIQMKNNSQDQITKARLDKEQQALKSGQSRIEQQEQQHQQKMKSLQQSATVASAQENLIKAKTDKEYQAIKNGNKRIEMEVERHAARMTNASNNVGNSVLDRSSQYMLSGTMFYAFTRGATEAISVLKGFEYELVNVKRVMGDTADVEFVKESMIDNAKEYGYALLEVAEVYTLIAQQGFDERQTESLARTSLMAKNVEQSFSSAAEAQELMTGAILNYGMAAEDSEVLLDKLNEVSNQFPTTSKKLLDGINRTGAAAKNAGIDIDELIGYLTVLNQSGFTGSVAGNAIKSFISFSSRDIAIDKLEKYVGVMKHANGEMMQFPELLSRIAEKWDTMADAERHEVTQAIARGDQASRFIALMNNYSKVMDVAATSENSFGSAQRENALAMTTLEKQSLQLKASWDELIISMGDSGLLDVLKALTHNTTLLVDGFSSLPDPIRNTITAVLLLGGSIAVLNTGTRLFTGQSLVSMVTGLTAGARAMLGMKTATDLANVSQKAFIATPVGAALAGIALVLGVATTAWSYYKGAQNEVSDEILQQNRDTSNLVNKYEELKSIVDDNTKSDKEVTAAKHELAAVIEKISGVMPGLISQWDELGKAKDVDVEKIESWKFKYTDSMKIIEQANLDAANKRKNELDQEIGYTLYAIRNASKSDLSIVSMAMGTTVRDLKEKWANEVAVLGAELAAEEQKIKSSQDAINALNGTTSEAITQTGNLSSNVLSVAGAMDEFGENTEYATDAQDEQFKTIEDLEKAHQNLESEILGNSKAISELNTVSRELTEGQSMNAASATDLILKYPQLADAIYKTADGWAFETNAVDILRKAKIQKAIDDLAAEKASSFNTKIATEERLAAYGIEAAAVKSLAELKARVNGSKVISADNVTTTGDDLKYFKQQFKQQGLDLAAKENELDSIFAEYDSESKIYDAKIKTLSGLYNDPSFGQSESSKKKGSSSASKAKKDDPLQKQFEASQKYIEHQKAMGRLSTEQELAAWERVQARYKLGSEQRLKSDEKVYELRKKVTEEISKKEKEAYDASMKWISHKKGISEVSAEQELEMLLRVQARYKAGSQERMELDEKVYVAKKVVEQEYFSNFQKNLNHQKAMDQLTAEEELKAWIKIQGMYREGTDQKMQADEQVYALKKKLIEDEQQSITELVKVQKTSLDKVKNDAVKRIEDERDAFLAAQDAKIQAIDDQIQAMDRLNDEDDYERALAEKQARLALLQSAVGPDGIKERKQVAEDIEDMQREHDRKLTKQSLEDQKKGLQDEKDLKKTSFDKDIQDSKEHYDQLLQALEDFSSDTANRSEIMKNIQVLKESEKNAEILAQLDQFIFDYQTKMSAIDLLSPTHTGSTNASMSNGGSTQKQQDLKEYNSNKDAWDNAKSSKNKAEMDRLSARNEELRNKYGIVKDTGKLQTFHDGGIVQGARRGEETQVTAKVGEMYINDQQQANLFKMLNFKMPQLSFSMPNFSMPVASGGSNPHQISNTFEMNSGDNYFEDESQIKTYWSERDNFVRRVQSRGGGKG